MNDFEIADLAAQLEGLHEQVEYLLACCEECDNCKPIKTKKGKK
jgi:hypothetical protein